MIQILQSYCTTDGQLFKNLSDCQEHALELLLKDKSAADQTIYQTMVQHADAVIAILGGKVEPKAKARKTRRDKGLPRKKDVTIAEIRGIMPQTSKPFPVDAIT
jgi:hypothetical protein